MMYPDQRIRCESLAELYVSRSHVFDPLAVGTFLVDVFPNLRLHHRYFSRTTPWGPSLRKLWDFDDEFSEDEQSPKYIEMAQRWKDVDKCLYKKRRLELSQSPTNTNVRMQSSTI
jgi:hypothetical protein